MTSRLSAAACAGRQRGTPNWKRGRSRATSRGTLTGQRRRRRPRFRRRPRLLPCTPWRKRHGGC
eukprot:8101563-Pyramimonas_sp.AAC.1